MFFWNSEIWNAIASHPRELYQSEKMAQKSVAPSVHLTVLILNVYHMHRNWGEPRRCMLDNASSNTGYWFRHIMCEDTIHPTLQQCRQKREGGEDEKLSLNCGCLDTCWFASGDQAADSSVQLFAISLHLITGTGPLQPWEPHRQLMRDELGVFFWSPTGKMLRDTQQSTWVQIRRKLRWM